MRTAAATLWCVAAVISARAQQLPEVRNSEGIKIAVTDEDTQPVLHLVVPGDDAGDTMKVLFPEHVTVRRQGTANADQLYLFRPGKSGEQVQWKRNNRFIEYERDFSGGVHMLARATLEDDGVLFHYEFTNRSDIGYAMVIAVTDPRMTSIFHDVRLERTYVHRRNGFELLAQETPSRLTMPLSEWLPLRYLASYTWAVPATRKERRADGITYYNASQPVDEPMIATVSTDGKWIAASFTRTTGNVWSNPELTCQHVDPERTLPAHGSAVWETKLLVFRGTLDQALQKVREQKNRLK